MAFAVLFWNLTAGFRYWFNPRLDSPRRRSSRVQLWRGNNPLSHRGRQ